MKTMIGNWMTTLMGFVMGLSSYLGKQGVVVPHDTASLKAFGWAAGMFIFGLVMKDANVGLKPGEKPAVVITDPTVTISDPPITVNKP